MNDGVPAPEAGTVRALAERITASPSFQRSPRLREVLRYIVESALQDPPLALTEHQIGVSIFNRPPQYDSSSDTIVRVQVSQLRKKLEHYYLTLGQNEPLVIEIPRGSYNAVFRWQTPEPAAAQAATEVSAPSGTGMAPASAGHRRLVVALASVSVLLAVVCVWLGVRLWRNTKEAPDTGPTVQAFWANLIAPGRMTDIVAADSAFAFIQDGIGAPLDLEQYLHRDPQQWVATGKPDSSTSRLLNLLGHRQYTSYADLAIARRILFLNPACESQVSIVFARSFQARAAATNNVILLGSRRSNPWVQLYADQLNFPIDYDETTHRSVVRNRNPRAGEASTYTVQGEGAGIKDGYAVIAYLPNTQRSAKALILAGTHTEATEAVGRLATTESSLRPALARIAGNGPIPHFEALSKTRRFGGTPQQIDLIAWRVLSN
jgi:hypothetical protein